jgi:hypothetical protein
MKRVLYRFWFLLIIFSAVSANSQSPYLSVKATMLRDTAHDTNYGRELQICSIENGSANIKLFSGDTSKIDFAKLSSNDFHYSAFISTSDTQLQLNNNFSYGNQIYGFEKILVLRITNRSSAGLILPMFIVMPIKYESFVTFVELRDIVFKPGKIIYLEKVPNKRNKEKHLVINESLKDYPTMSLKQFPLKLRLEEF